jgi:hypothetical protein
MKSKGFSQGENLFLVSGERGRLARWFLRPAETIFLGKERTFQKFVMARRRRSPKARRENLTTIANPTSNITLFAVHEFICHSPHRSA